MLTDHCITFYLFGLFKITKAPITPGTQAHSVSKKTMKKEPQPLSITDKGGNRIANNTRKKLIAYLLVSTLKRRFRTEFVT